MAVSPASDEQRAASPAACPKCTDSGVVWSSWSCDGGNRPSRCDCQVALALAERRWARLEILIAIGIALVAGVLLATFR